MTIYWPGVILCLIAVTAGLALWWRLLPREQETVDEVAAGPIVLEHHGDFYEVDDLWDA